MSTKGAHKTKRNHRSFNTYVSIVQKKRHPTRGMTKSTRAFYDALAKAVVTALTSEALRCMKSRKTKTLGARDVSLAGARGLPDAVWNVITNKNK